MTENNPYKEMARLFASSAHFIVNVKTTHNGVEMEIRGAGVVSVDGDWLVLQTCDDYAPPSMVWLHKKAVAALEIEQLC